ncbi:unnamed protein product [Phytophthora fragariaefolia]|uniref:Unnamed protein product n=1 Tax=Phytophthora fragariaefolia TaxID=1490495 RepID=A0A9W6U815_9STRA|nr:unnamed protein product [Phytophthora fragariaefolia]
MENTTFKLEVPTAATTSIISVSLQDGIYSYEDINRSIQTALVNAGAYLIDSTGNNVYYIRVGENSVYYACQVDFSPTPTSLPVGYTRPATGLYFSGGSGLPTTTLVPRLIIDNAEFGKVLGLTAGTYPSASATVASAQLSNIIPQIHPTSSYIVRCDLIKNEYVASGDIVSAFDRGDAEIGKLISYKPSQCSCSGLVALLSRYFSPESTTSVKMPLRLAYESARFAPFLTSPIVSRPPPGGASIPNDGFVKRLLSNPPTAGSDFTSSWPSVGGTAASTTISNQTSRGAFVVGAVTANAIMGTWNHMLKIKLTDLHPIFREIDLMANPQIRLHFRVNQGTSVIAVDATKGMSLTSTTLSSGNSCPVMIAASSTGNRMTSVLATYAGFSVSWGAWFYQPAGIGKQSTQLNASFALQLSASVKNAKYIAVLPFAEQTSNFATAAVQQFQSPFDSSPWTLQPGSSIRNFNVRIGSTRTFDISHDYDFHHFTNEVAKIGAINGDLTPELVNGLLDYQTWSLTNRMLIADVSRLTERGVPQSIQIQGTNAGCQGVNLLVLVISEQELTFDRLTGEVLDFTTA